MSRLPDTCSVTDFRDNIADHLRQLRKADRPRMITQNGKAAAVELSPQQFEDYAAAMDFMQTIEAVESSRAELAAGGGAPWSRVRARLLDSKSRRQPKTRRSA
jgi:PHD/YefM family antitoxin component YafN of YafNO toxin-antitoxin module